jgi:hypothetical protein
VKTLRLLVLVVCSTLGLALSAEVPEAISGEAHRPKFSWDTVVPPEKSNFLFHAASRM